MEILSVDVGDLVKINILSEDGKCQTYQVLAVTPTDVSIQHPQKGVLTFSRYLVFWRQAQTAVKKDWLLFDKERVKRFTRPKGKRYSYMPKF